MAKTVDLTLCVAAIWSAAALLACSEKEARSQGEHAADKVQDTVREVGQGAREAAEAADRKRGEWVKRTEQRLAELDRKLEALRARGSNAAERLGDNAVERVQSARKEARTALEEARQSSEQTWDKTKRSADDAIDRVQAAYQHAVDALGSGD